MPTDLKFFRLRKAFLSTTLLIFTREVLSSTYPYVCVCVCVCVCVYIYIYCVCVAQLKVTLCMYARNSGAHTFFHIFVYLKVKVFWNMTPCRLAVTDVSENHAASGIPSHPRTLNPYQQHVTNSRRFHFFPFLFCLFIYRPSPV